MPAISPSRFLRNVLLFDAFTCLAMGVGLTVLSTPLSSLLLLPESLLTWAGASLFPFAALLAVTARRATSPTVLVWAIIGANALWAVDSFAIGLLDWVSPNRLGSLFLYGQALATASLSALEVIGLRRS